ncbi:MAG: DNA adenine methylase [Synergistes sp.]|nr:DNA adenine methylase [Synergistes sp.]
MVLEYEKEEATMSFQIWNRRYTGSKYKLADWISGLIGENCKGTSFCDIFAGTAVVSKRMIEHFDTIYINDFLFSNEVIYRAFFEQTDYCAAKMEHYKELFLKLDARSIPAN